VRRRHPRKGASMKKTEIEHMWKVASNNPHHDTNWHDPAVVAFAQLVAQKEREECETVCDNLYRVWVSTDDDDINPPDALDCKRAIRARGQA
jgi:hypothetical protein